MQCIVLSIDYMHEKELTSITSSLQKPGNSFLQNLWERGGALRERYSVKSMTAKYLALYEPGRDSGSVVSSGKFSSTQPSSQGIEQKVMEA